MTIVTDITRPDGGKRCCGPRIAGDEAGVASIDEGPEGSLEP
jgi:hypothetical protein